MGVINTINFTAPASGGWLVNLIMWLVKISSSVAIGVILFTIILKVITLPFDYFSRASMRKNSVKMEQMRPELEKLQKQYADNKDLYNQKMMALYKKNGYSMFGACLPTILTLVIFIVAINAFTDYSKFQNQQYFYNMSNSYNNVVYAGFDIDEEERYIYRDSKGKIVVKLADIIPADESEIEYDKEVVISANSIKNGAFEITYSITPDSEKAGNYNFSLYTTNSYILYQNTYYIKDGQRCWIGESFKDRQEGLQSNVLATKENNGLKIVINGVEYSFADAQVLDSQKWTAKNFILDICQEKSAETYRREQQSFLWVKNIWATDSTTSHPIESDWSTFKNTHGYEGADIKADGYNNLIAKLSYEKTAPNGYFILIALTAISSLIMQLVGAKAQKAQMELQTVDGQGAQTQKVMQWVMPIMMAIFAFMYTAAFSIYIIISSVFSIGTTFLINFIVDKQIKKEELNKKKDQKVRGRVYTPPKEPNKKEEPKKEKKKKETGRFAHEDGGDFLTGKKKK